MSSRAVDRSTDSADGVRLNAATFLRGITALVLFATAVLLVGGTTAAVASTYTYDAPIIARTHVHEINAADARSTLLRVAKEESARPLVEAQGTSTTPLTRNAATEAAPPRFVAASDGIIDTEAPALQQQIGDVADSIQTTGSSPPGVRQGGLPGKPGVYGNKSGALPTQPEGYYTESDVWPGPGSRGTERIVVGANGEVWYSPDHYGNFRVVAT